MKAYIVVLWEFINGYKTYIIGVATIAFSVLGYFAGKIDFDTMYQSVQVSLIGMGVRHGVSKL